MSFEAICGIYHGGGSWPATDEVPVAAVLVGLERLDSPTGRRLSLLLAASGTLRPSSTAPTC